MSKPLRSFCLLATLALGLAPTSQAYEGISTVNVTTTVGTPSKSADGASNVNDTATYTNFSNNVAALSGFSTTGGSAYTVANSAPYALVQRNAAATNNPQSSVWYASNTGGFAGVHQDTYGAMLKSNNFYEGADNVFNNGTATASGNIERLDFTWGQAFGGDLSTLAFAVFDRGGATIHDAFTIALVTGIYTAADADAAHPVGTPKSYGGFLKVAAGWGAATNPVADRAYNLFRYNRGDDTTASTAHNETGTQGVGGVVIKASELGAGAGTTVYGYSLMGYDVAPRAGTPDDLLDVTNATYYPTSTVDANGGIDLAAINGLEVRTVVPEPSAWALLCVAVAGAGVGTLYRRRRQA